MPPEVATYEAMLDEKLTQLSAKLEKQHAEREAQALAAERAKNDEAMKALRAAIDEILADKAESRKYAIPGLMEEKKPDGTVLTTGDFVQYAFAQTNRPGATELRGSRHLGLVTDAVKQYAAQTGQNFGDGGGLIPHQVVMSDMIPLLQKETVGGQLGIRVVPGMTGTISFPKKLTTHTVGYVDTEAFEAAPDSKGTIGDISASPHMIAGSTQLSWAMLTQTNGLAQMMTRDELLYAAALFADTKLFNGSGVNGEPLGLNAAVTPLGINTSDWTSVDLLGADQSITKKLGEMYWKLLHAHYRGTGSLRYVGETLVGQRLGNAVDTDGRPLFRGVGDLPTARVDAFDGYPMVWNNNVQPATPSTSAAEFWFGDWSQLWHLFWGQAELRVVEINDDVKRKRMTVVVHMPHDVLIRQPKAFCKATTVAVTNVFA